MKHKSIIEKFNREIIEDNGGRFLKINWSKKSVHYLTGGGYKKIKSLVIPKIVIKNEKETTV